MTRNMPPAGSPLSARVFPPRMKPGTGDEVDLLHKTPLLMLHRDDHVGEARDVISAPGSRQPRLRRGRGSDVRRSSGFRTGRSARRP